MSYYLGIILLFRNFVGSAFVLCALIGVVILVCEMISYRRKRKKEEQGCGSQS